MRSVAGWVLVRWRRASLRTKIYLCYLALISVPLLVVAVAAYRTSRTTIEQNAQSFSAQLTGEIRANLDTYAEQSTRLTFWPFQGLDIQRVLAAYQRATARPPAFGDLTTMHDRLSLIGHERADIAGIYVVTRNGTLFHWTASGDLVPHPATDGAGWYRAALAADPRVVFLPTTGQEMIAVATGKVFSLVRALHDRQTGALLGAVRVDLEASALASVVQQVSLGAQGQLLVVTPDGALVYPIDPLDGTAALAREIASHRGTASLGRLTLDVRGAALLATYNRSLQSGWIVAGVVPEDRLLSGANHLRTLILTVAVLCILAGALCATLVVGKLTGPIRQLRGAMRLVEDRVDLDTRIRVHTEDEVGQLAHGFNAMLDEIRRLVDDVLRAQIHEREAELQALQTQINPHFLYNTLESINMLALTHGDRDISRMVTALGRLLRLTISAPGVLIPLRSELEYVNHYLVVQRMRYGERIRMEIDVDEALLDNLLPKLTLQPIVENSLYHGLEPKRGQGRVRVYARSTADVLQIVVADDGVGMDAETLESVQRSLLVDAPRGGRSVGLANVQQRLKLYCGRQFGLAVRSTPGQGTEVTITMPQRLPERAAAVEDRVTAR